MTMKEGSTASRDFELEARALATEQNNFVLAGLEQGLVTQTNIDLKTLLALFKKILQKEDFERLVQESFNVRNHKKIAVKDLEELKHCMSRLKENLENSTNVSDKILRLSDGVFANINSNISRFEHVRNGSEIFLKVGNYDSLAAEIEKKKLGRLTKLKHFIVPGAKKKYQKKQQQVAEQTKISNFEIWKDEMLKASVAAASQLFVVNSSDQQIAQLKKLIRRHADEQSRINPPPNKHPRGVWSEIRTTAKQLTTTVAENVVAEYFAKETQLDTRASDDLNLNQHAKNAFDYAIKRAAFDIMFECIENVYHIYQYSKEYDPRHGLDLAQQGFKRLQEPAFKEFMLKMLDNLGFDIEDPELMLKLVTMTPQEREHRREMFARNTSPEATAKFVKAKDTFFHECAVAKALPSPNEYYGLMSFSEQALLNVESKQRLANMTKLLPDIDSLANYNPELSYGVVTHTKFAVREMIKNRLVDIVAFAMESVDKQRIDAQLIAESDFEAIRNIYFDESRQSSRASTSHIRVNKEWEKAMRKVKPHDPAEIQQIMTTPTESIDRIMLEQFQKTWRKEAIKLFSLVHQGGYDLFYNLAAALEKEISDLKYQHATPEAIELAESQLRAFVECFGPSNPDVLHELKHCSHEQLSTLSAAMTKALNQLNAQDVVAMQTIDDHQLFVAMKQAFASLGTSLAVPETVFAAYDELVRNDRARLNYEDPSFMTKWVAEKGAQLLADYLNENFKGPRITLKYLIKQKSKQMYQLSSKGTENVSSSPVAVPITASFSTTPQAPVPVQEKQTYFQWGASLLGLELDDIKLQEKQVIDYANKLQSLLIGNNDPITTYARAKEVYALADAIIEQLRMNAAIAHRDYQEAAQRFREELPAKQATTQSMLQGVAQGLKNIATTLRQADSTHEIAPLLRDLYQAREQLEVELAATRQVFEPHKRAYQQQGMIDFSKSPEYSGLSIQIMQLEQLIHESVMLGGEMADAYTQRESRGDEITTAIHEVINNPTSTHSLIVKLYQAITSPQSIKNAAVNTQLMQELLDKLDQDMLAAQETVHQNPKGYFYWTTSQAALDAEEALALVQQRQLKVQALKEQYVRTKGREPLVNIEIAKELQALAPQLIFDEGAAYEKCQRDYVTKCAALATKMENIGNKVGDIVPYFARPSLLEADAKLAEQQYKNAIKYQGEIGDHIENVTRMRNLVSVSHEITKDQKNGQAQIDQEQGFTYNFVYYLLDKYFSGAGLTKTALKAIVSTYAGTLINQSANRASDLEVVLVHHLGQERAAQLQTFLATVQVTYNALQTSPLSAKATWTEVAKHGLYAGTAAGVVAGVPAALWAIPSGPAGMITAGTVAGTSAGVKAAALAMGASVLAPIVAEVTQEAVDYALKRALGPQAVSNFYRQYHSAKAVVSEGVRIADKVTMASVNDWYNKAPDKEKINDVLVAEGRKAFRGQTFDVFLEILRQLHELTEVINASDNSQYRFAELGFDRLQSRDFALIKKYMTESLGLEPSDLNRPLDPEYINHLRESFIAGVITQDNSQIDPFIKLMGTVSKEYKDVIHLIEQGKLKHSCNYVSLVTAMYDIVSKVEIVQKATKATELYMPNLNQKLKTQAQDGNKKFIQYFKENAALQSAPVAAKIGVAYMVQDSVTQATNMANNLVVAAKTKLTELETLTPLSAEASSEHIAPSSSRRMTALTFVTRRKASSASASASSSSSELTPRTESSSDGKPRRLR